MFVFCSEMDENIVQYKAKYDFEPSEEFIQDGCISLREGDLLEVYPWRLKTLEGTLENPEGWLEGLNKNSNKYGQFPAGQYVECIPMTPQVPKKRPVPKPRRPVPTASGIETSDSLPTRLVTGAIGVDGNDSGYVGSPQGRNLIKFYKGIVY